MNDRVNRLLASAETYAKSDPEHAALLREAANEICALRSRIEIRAGNVGKAVPVAWQKINAPYSILTPEQYGNRLPLAEGSFHPLYAAPPKPVADMGVNK